MNRITNQRWLRDLPFFLSIKHTIRAGCAEAECSRTLVRRRVTFRGVQENGKINVKSKTS